jgi:uncharacterized Fe-S radical SAM superfamily protein PflX
MHPATEKQIKYFFVLCNDLGYDTEEAKERAKKKYHLEHFNLITTSQLSELIDLLINKLNKKEAQDNEKLKDMDKKILDAGYDTSVCVVCGEECIVTAFVDPPICTRLKCVRKFFAGDFK